MEGKICSLPKRPYIDENVSYDGYPQNAEKVNGRWAMVGFVALVGAYVTTDKSYQESFNIILPTSSLELKINSILEKEKPIKVIALRLNITPRIYKTKFANKCCFRFKLNSHALS